MAITQVQNIGTLIRSRREAAGWTREQLARESKVSTTTITRLELEDRIPRTEPFQQIIGALGIPARDLLMVAVA